MCFGNTKVIQLVALKYLDVEKQHLSFLSLTNAACLFNDTDDHIVSAILQTFLFFSYFTHLC